MALAGLSLPELLAVAGVALSLTVALYVLRTRRRPVRVASIRHFERVAEARAFRRLWQQLRRWLSLLLQLVIAGLVVLALGDPYLGGTRRPGTQWVLLMDNSLSMAAQDVKPTRLGLAISHARSLISGLGPTDQAMIVELGARPKPLTALTGDSAELGEALDTLRAKAVSANLDAGLRFAASVLRGAPAPRIVLLSDGSLQESRKPETATASELAPAKSPTPPITWIATGQGGPNVAIREFSVRRYPLDRARYEVLLEITNQGASATEVEVALFGDDDVVDISRLHLSAGESIPRFFSDLGGARRQLRAEIRPTTGEDLLPQDNVAYALLPERRQIPVLLITQGNAYLEAALLLDQSLIVTQVAPSDPLPGGPFLVTVLDELAPELGPEHGARIYLAPPKDGAPVPLGRQIRDFGFDSWRRQSPLLRWMTMENIQVTTGHALLPQAGDVVEGRSEFGPILVSGTRDGSRFVQLGFAPRDSDFVLRIGWPLFLLNTINAFSAQTDDYVASYQTGRTWHIPIPKDVLHPVLTRPDGSRLSVPAAGGQVQHFGEEQGIFHVGDADLPEQFSFAANLGASAESDLTIPDALPVPARRLTAPEPTPPRERYSLWMWLVLSALALSILEWQSFHRRLTL